MKNKLFNPENKVVFHNFISLSAIQLLNYILPLITFPYLLRVLGVDKYGFVNFSLSFIIYFQILVDFGFNYSATKLISANQNDKQKISEIFTTTLLLKIVLGILGFIPYLIIIISNHKFNLELIYYLVLYGEVIYSVFFPIWFFQGIEKMKYLLYLNLLNQSLFIVLLFLYVKGPQDILNFILISTGLHVIIGIISICIIKFKIKIPKSKISRTEIMNQFKLGIPFFISFVAINVYTVSNTFFLGLLTSDYYVGIFSAGYKIISIITCIYGPFSQAFYPHIVKNLTINREKILSEIKNLLIIMNIIGFSAFIVLLFFADQIIFIIAGSQYQETATVLKILSPIPILVANSNVFTFQILIPFNYQKNVSIIFVIAALLDILMIFILVPFLNYIGVCIILLIIESFVTLSTYLMVKYKIVTK